jgi:hypothetical protein
MKNRFAFAAILLVILLSAGWFIYQGDNTPHPTNNTVAIPASKPADNQWTPIKRDGETDAAVKEKIDDKDLPPAPIDLEQSDTATILAAQTLSPKFSESIQGEQQIRKWVSMIDMLADGNLPNKNLPIRYTMKPFEVTTASDGKLSLSAANYARITPLLDAVTTIPADAMAKHYRSWKPLLEQAYAELGKPDTFETRLRTMIFRIVAIPALPAAPELIHPSVYYKFADPELEKADALSKFIWRLGPENQKRIQDYLRELQPLL